MIAEAGVGMPNMFTDPMMPTMEQVGADMMFNDIMGANFPDGLNPASVNDSLMPGGMDPGMLDAFMQANFAFDTLQHTGSEPVAELDESQINALVAPSLAFEALNAEAVTEQIANQNTTIDPYHQAMVDAELFGLVDQTFGNMQHAESERRSETRSKKVGATATRATLFSFLRETPEKPKVLVK